MKQANYNGRFRAALAVLGVALTASHRLRVRFVWISSPHVASLRAAQYGVTHGCDPSGVPCSLCEQLGLPIACPAMPLRALLCEQLGLPIAYPEMPIRALLSEQLSSRLRTLRCRFSIAADRNQRGELAMPICPVGAVRCSVAFP